MIIELLENQEIHNETKQDKIEYIQKIILELKRKGVSYIDISKEIGISNWILSKFMNWKLNFSDKYVNKLLEKLKQK